ncbi:uncharacterized protein Z519_04539 [Cladophialophora bantiana CBS 173.52]|uniref:Uncharacterized protein n=1 Tax=Cladophialophora bantiana (strain ATCC 10958 / CBS 173.52 / CDC B-1940 / NIH 8579) TaxID=1442370 RepID=A0A0D2HMK1_CLAB1|nr:uncharacterized protein Z519_04539 [Cladophialophora bantiana CBS 173.52]KIW94563.1 hypothetical protein Z519_04539 [Cladophialophora bantiana CBS 173.52]
MGMHLVTSQSSDPDNSAITPPEALIGDGLDSLRNVGSNGPLIPSDSSTSIIHSISWGTRDYATRREGYINRYGREQRLYTLGVRGNCGLARLQELCL